MTAILKRNSSTPAIAWLTLLPVLGSGLMFLVCFSKLGADGFVGLVFILTLCLTSPFFASAFLLSIFWRGTHWMKMFLMVVTLGFFLASLLPILGLVELAMMGPINPG